MRRRTTVPAYPLICTAIAGATLVLLLLAPDDTRAADPERGRLLYENHCTGCHTSVVHLREQRKATTREEIQSWIRRWQAQLELQWDATEVDDVTEYLNERYYQLKSDS
ncbi:MAG: cytochrome c [Gammaproteobacteria bacterium]|nr:cytochrome c [Gammaproteobacteria bacterium]NIM72610.1 cytochrome c [Gammaproteobacteria bacterium]NIN37667.1 cytochrome c [Gammaproteobacteria bacterium]NIO24371.1 cytochrome c [Gammaproteobacteria bacterium]NIO64974.1 cytochrome c [Gammaproteobacteria bacterium]